MDLACRAMDLYCVGMGVGGPKFEEFITRATKPNLVSLIGATEGHRAPGIFKVAAKYGDAVERTPLNRP